MTDNVEERVDNLDSRTKTTHVSTPVKKPVDKGKIALSAFIILIGMGIVLGADVDEFQGVQDYFFGEEAKTVEPLEPARIELYTFSDPYDNDSVNVEFWLINIGDEIGTDIEVYIRARDQNGTILFSETVDTTTLLLRYNETCSGWYTVPYTDAEYITHTIEISWDIGRAGYLKKTTLI